MNSNLNLDVKKLRIIAVFLIIVLVAVLVVVAKKTRLPSEDNTRKNYGAILNNNSHLIQYGDTLYYQNEYTNQNGEYKSKLTKLSLKDDELSPVNLIDFDRESITDNNMLLYDNMIYIVYSSDTYQYDIDNNVFKMFCQGSLQYFDGNRLVFLYLNDLYSANYNGTTNAIYNIERLTVGNMKRLCEDDDNIYYVSPGHKNNLLIVALDKKDFSVITLSQGESSQNEVTQAVVSKNFLYCNVKDGNEEIHVLKINLKTLERQVILLKDYSSVHLFINDSSDKLYFYGINEDVTDETTGDRSDGKEKVYVIDDDKILEKDAEDVKVDIFKNYTAYYSSNIIYLYNKGKLVGTLNYPISGKVSLTVKYAYTIDEYLYYMISIEKTTNDNTKSEDERLSNSEYESINGTASETNGYVNEKILVRVNKDSEEVQKLNYKISN